MKIKNIEDMSKEELKTLASQPSKPTAIIVVVSSCAATAGLYSWLKLSLGQSLPYISQVIWLVFLVTTIYMDKQINKIETRQKALIELLRKSDVIKE